MCERLYIGAETWIKIITQFVVNLFLKIRSTLYWQWACRWRRGTDTQEVDTWWEGSSVGQQYSHHRPLDVPGWITQVRRYRILARESWRVKFSCSFWWSTPESSTPEPSAYVCPLWSHRHGHDVTPHLYQQSRNCRPLPWLSSVQRHTVLDTPFSVAPTPTLWAHPLPSLHYGWVSPS